MNEKELLDNITEAIFSKKGYDVKILDVRKLTSIADYFVIASASSDMQVKAVSEEVEDRLAEDGVKCYNRDGYDTLNWVILDYFDVMVHVFKEDTRDYYKLDKLWADAPTIEVKDATENIAEK